MPKNSISMMAASALFHTISAVSEPIVALSMNAQMKAAAAVITVVTSSQKTRRCRPVA
jgi:hypothetical protein